MLHRSWTLFLVLAGLGPIATAQNYERYRPLPVEPPPARSIPQVQPEQLEAVEGSDKVLVKELKAVIVLDNGDKVDAEDAHEGLTGIDYDFDAGDSLVFRSGVQNIINRYLGGEVTLRNLNQMSRDIILYYRKVGQPVVDVLIPEQKITAGVVQIVVVESRIAKVRIQNGCYFDAKGLARWVECTCRGSRIYEANISNDLFWLNQNPFRRVGVDLQPGAQEGTTDVIFEVDDVIPLRAYLGYEDTGVQSLGLERFNAGVIYGNFLGRDGILSYQYTSDSQFSRLQAHSASFLQPINRQWSFNTFGSWAAVTPDIAGPINQDGESWQVGTGLTRHLVKNRKVDWSSSFGFDFKSTNNNLEFGGQNVQASGAELVQLRLGMRYLRRNECGEYDFFNFDNFVGPGEGFSKLHNAAAFRTIRANTDPSYYYARMRLERLRNIKNRFQLVSRFVGQIASERLLFSETIGFGGFDTIRGYDQRVYSADSGCIGSIEFGPKPYRFGSCSSPNTLRTFGFVDAGSGFIDNVVPGEISNEFLISTGVGLRLSLNERVSLRAEYGHGFQSVPGITGRDRVHIGLVTLMGPRP